MAAGAVVIAGGSLPATPSGVNVTVWPPNGINDSNGHTLDNRLLMTTPQGGLVQLTNAHLPNYVRNSGFWFAQRQAPGSATTYSATAGRAISADGWGITNENASATFRRVDTSGAAETGMQGRYYGSFLKTTSNGKLIISQVIEGSDAQALKNRNVRVQLWMKGDGATPTVRVGLLALSNAGTIDTIPATFVSAFGGASVDPTFGANISKLTGPGLADGGTIATDALTCVLSASWKRFSAVWPTQAAYKNLILCIWSDSAITAAQGFDIGQVSLTDGSEYQDWSPMSLAAEYNRALRFYQRSFAIEATGPAQNVGVNTGEYRGIAGKAGAVANSGFIPIEFSVPMRAQPTVTIFNPAAANALARNITGAADMGASAITNQQSNGFYVNATGVAATAVGDLIAIHWTADAEI